MQAEFPAPKLPGLALVGFLEEVVGLRGGSCCQLSHASDLSAGACFVLFQRQTVLTAEKVKRMLKTNKVRQARTVRRNQLELTRERCSTPKRISFLGTWLWRCRSTASTSRRRFCSGCCPV